MVVAELQMSQLEKGDYNLKVLVAESNFINADTRHMNFNFIAVSDWTWAQVDIKWDMSLFYLQKTPSSYMQAASSLPPKEYMWTKSHDDSKH